MRMKFSNRLMTTLAAISLATRASAHPGHSPTDVAAQVSQPLAGADHFIAFVALTTVLLLTLRFVVKARAAKMEKAPR